MLDIIFPLMYYNTCKEQTNNKKGVQNDRQTEI